MVILIIVIILIAIAYIFGKGPAQVIILGSGGLVIGGVIIFLVGALIYYLWGQIKTNESVQSVLGFLLVIFIVIPALSLMVDYGKKWFKKHDNETISSPVSSTGNSFTEKHPFVTLSIIILVFLFSYRIWSALHPEIIQPPDNFSNMSITIDSENYSYILKGTTNVRSCASINCAVIGQYPANTSFDLTNSLSDLPEWVQISWIDEKGQTQYGYIHKSTLKPSAFDTLKSKSE